MNSRTAVDSEGSWFEPEQVTELRRRLPIPYVDIIPVRTDVDGSVEEVGLLLRASGSGQIVRAIVSGRVLVHETIREAIARHIDKDLGPMAMPRIPVSPVPFTVAEYFPTPGISPFHDPRQHAISMAYVVPIDGETAPQEDALELTWFGIDELVAEYEELYDVVPELRRGGERHESLRYGARQELGLRRFLEEGGFGAFTTNFEDLGGLRQLPGLAVQRLMADGYGFGAEGDWKTAILVRVAAVMGHGLPGGASLMEDYTYELTPGREQILGAHMLEVSPSLTTAKPSLEIHPLGIGDREDPVRLKFTADAGPAVVVALSDMRERFRLVANVVNVVEPAQELPKLPVACAVWEPAPDFATSAECWLTAGAAHHTVMTSAVGLEIWEDLATIGDIELAIIDESTTVRSFAQDLRTNQVFYRLGQGF